MKVLFLAAALALFAGSAAAQQSVIATTAPCLTSPYNVWSNIPFASQSGPFEFQFDATPSAAELDGTMGLSGAAATGWPQLAVTLRFNSSGFIDAQQGPDTNASYSAVNSVPYTAGTTYHFTVDVNQAAKTYSAYVGTSTRTTIALNYAYRSTATGTTLSDLGLFQDAASGTNKICNPTVLTTPGTTNHQVSLSWGIATDPAGAPPVLGYNVFRSLHGAGVYTAINAALVVGTSFSDASVQAGDEYDYYETAENSVGQSGPSNVQTIAVP